MDFAEKCYARIVLVINDNGLGDRRKRYFADYRKLHDFLIQQDVDFSIVRSGNHDAELLPYIDLKERGDVPVRYISAWLNDPKIKANALERVRRIKDTLEEEAVESVLEGIGASRKK